MMNGSKMNQTLPLIVEGHVGGYGVSLPYRGATVVTAHKWADPKAGKAGGGADLDEEDVHVLADLDVLDLAELTTYLLRRHFG